MALPNEIAQKTIKIICKETGESHEIQAHFLQISTFITTSLLAAPDRTVFVINLKPQALKHILHYLRICNGVEPRLIEPPLRSRRMHELCEKVQDAELIDNIAAESPQLLYDVAVGALYFQIQSLIHLSCAKIASTIKSHPLDKVKTILVAGQVPQQPQQQPQQPQQQPQQPQTTQNATK